ncbi:metallophosphoesterase [Bradyrhizobium diazoefficiens]|nr:metallophosphoesterase [Bradyrhizobium diazoefficiens]MBR0778788.1 metallophosphoesterase [Bradyrhizobium diazoefficiens]
MGPTHHLIVISDLHLGGRPPADGNPGFELCPAVSRRRLARLIRRLAARPDFMGDGDTIELVINGDLIDFLAEEPFVPFTKQATEAIEKLERIIQNCDRGSKEEESVFPALAEFVGLGNKLTVLLGNHDIELSLPAVRRSLASALTGGRPARVEFVFDGEAYVIRDVLIEHGNRYDGWNAVEYGALRAYRSSVSRGEEPFPFQPPAGSRLVASIMNPLKRRYPFVDILKPENEAVLPILCALEPKLVLELKRVAPLWLAMLRTSGKLGRVKREETFIASGMPAALPATEASGAVLEPARTPDNPNREHTFRSTNEILDEAGRLADETLPQEPRGRVPPGTGQIAVGVPAWLSSGLGLWDAVRAGAAATRSRLLSRALRAQREAIGTTFDLDAKDSPYFSAAERLHAAAGARFVLFGHTHLAKSIALPSHGRYVNTGTWCPTMRLPPEFYEEEPSEKTLEGLTQFIMDLADNKIAHWTELKTFYGHIRLPQDGPTRVDLCEVKPDGAIKVHPGEPS